MDQDVPPPSGDEDAAPAAADDPLSRDAVELRRLIDAGAGTPEELRALAERIREHRALEEARWRSDVRPELMAAKKWRNRRARVVDDEAADHDVRRNLKIGAALLGGALVLLVLATQAGAAFVVLPLLGVLAYAYQQGRLGADADDAADPELPPADPLG